MQRFSFQLSIGGKNIMSTKEKSPVIMDSPKPGKKADQQKVTNGELIIEKESGQKVETKPDLQKKNTGEEKIKAENDKNMETKKDEKPKRITKEQEEQLFKDYKHVSEEYKNHLLDFFKRADVNNFGFLTIHTFARAVRGLGFRGSDRTIAQMFLDINTNFDGEITIHELFAEMTKKDPKQRTEAELKEIFKKFDFDRDGFITKEELEKGLDKFNISRTSIMVTDYIRKTDRDGDGKISLKDFLQSCQKKEVLTI